MSCFIRLLFATALLGWVAHAAESSANEAPAPSVPRFSISNMDRSVQPGHDFYQFADGDWLKNNPVPADKSRWGSFNELAERNWYLIHGIIESATADTSSSAHSPQREVGDFYASAMDTNRIEQLRFQPISDDLKRIDGVTSTNDMFGLLADFHQRGIGGIFTVGFGPDAKNSSIYAYHLRQGGLSLPDRDYYLKDSFAAIRAQYRAHVTKMLTLLGEKAGEAEADAAVILDLETALANASRTRVELRDPDKNCLFRNLPGYFHWPG
jgi:putative endopeptidase